jgi:hypothetical protein
MKTHMKTHMKEGPFANPLELLERLPQAKDTRPPRRVLAYLELLAEDYKRFKFAFSGTGSILSRAI